MINTGLTVAGTPMGASSTAGKAAATSAADGTASGVLGLGLSDTYDTTDTDAAWIWVNPRTHK